jgi:uncharacterized protein
MADLTVIHEPDADRYTLMEGDTRLGLADYVIQGSTLAITHTEVDPSQRGRGLGAILVKGTLDQIRSETDYRVDPVCPFVVSYIERNPEYTDLTTR